MNSRRIATGIGVAVVGCAAWFPSLTELPLAWQQGLNATLDLGREQEVLWKENVRIVTPDNRRRFRDLSPRLYIVPLTRGRQSETMAVPVAHALAKLHVGSDKTEAYFYAGHFCALATLPGERQNPQCQAMFDTFELTEIKPRFDINADSYLTVYQHKKNAKAFSIAVYKIGARKLPPRGRNWPDGASGRHSEISLQGVHLEPTFLAKE